MCYEHRIILLFFLLSYKKLTKKNFKKIVEKTKKKRIKLVFIHVFVGTTFRAVSTKKNKKKLIK